MNFTIGKKSIYHDPCDLFKTEKARVSARSRPRHLRKDESRDCDMSQLITANVSLDVSLYIFIRLIQINFSIDEAQACSHTKKSVIIKNVRNGVSARESRNGSRLVSPAKAKGGKKNYCTCN